MPLYLFVHFHCSIMQLYYQRNKSNIFYLYFKAFLCPLQQKQNIACGLHHVRNLKDATYTSNIKNTLHTCGIQIHEMQMSISCDAQTMFCIFKSMTPVQTMFSRNFKIQKLFSDLISRDAYIILSYLIPIACCSLQLFSIT